MEDREEGHGYKFVKEEVYKPPPPDLKCSPGLRNI
jgi:hypothetical protein